METSLISIITPIYNASEHLVRCLDSIANQTYTNLEVILIDDGSTDESGKIADEYANRDSRFKVLHTGNNGVSSARNLGLEMCNGEYITFIDADDFILEQYIEKLYAVLKGKNVLHVISLPYNSYDGILSNDLICKETKITVVSVKEEFDYTKSYAYGTVWGGLYHRSLIDKTRFSAELFVGEDEVFFAELIKKSQRIAILEEQLYIYMIYEESSSRGRYDEKKKTNIGAWEIIQKSFEEYPSTFQSRLRARCCRTYLSELTKMVKSNYIDNEWHSFLVTNAKKTLKDLLCSSYSSKIKFLSVFHCLLPHIYEVAYKMSGLLKIGNRK